MHNPNETDFETTLDKIVNLAKMTPDKVFKYELNQSQDWVRDLLMELNEKCNSRDAEAYLGETELNIKITLKKLNNATFGPVLVAKGEIKAEFVTECVRTLEEMKDHMETEFKAAFIENIYAEEEEYAEMDELFIDNDVHELHYYELNKANLQEMIHEEIFLNINPYPVLDYDAPLPYGENEDKIKQ